MITTREQDQALDALALRHGALAVEAAPPSALPGSLQAISTTTNDRGVYLILANGAAFRQEDSI